MSVNLRVVQNFSHADKLEWAVGPVDLKFCGDFAATAKEVVDRQCRGDHSQERVTRLDEEPPATELLTGDIPRGKRPARQAGASRRAGR